MVPNPLTRQPFSVFLATSTSFSDEGHAFCMRQKLNELVPPNSLVCNFSNTHIPFFFTQPLTKKQYTNYFEVLHSLHFPKELRFSSSQLMAHKRSLYLPLEYGNHAVEEFVLTFHAALKSYSAFPLVTYEPFLPLVSCFTYRENPEKLLRDFAAEFSKNSPLNCQFLVNQILIFKGAAPNCNTDTPIFSINLTR